MDEIDPNAPAPGLAAWAVPSWIGGDLDQSIGLPPIQPPDGAAPSPLTPGQAPTPDVGPLTPPAPPPSMVGMPPLGAPEAPALLAAPSPPDAAPTIPAPQLGKAPHVPTQEDMVASEVARQRNKAETDPTGYAIENEQRALDKQKAADAEAELIRAKDVQDQLANMRLMEDAAAKAKQQSEADYQRALSLHVDQDHWWKTRTTEGKVASYVAAMIGGFLAPYQGGKNSGLDAINDAINQDVEVQTRNMESQRSAIGMHQNMVAQEYQRSGDIYRARETVRLAMLQGAQAQIAAARAKVDPLGTQAQQLTVAALGVQNAIDQQKMAMAQLNQKNATDLAKANAEIAAHQAEVEKAHAEIGNAAAARALAGRTAAREERGQLLTAAKEGLRWDPKAGAWVRDPSAPEDPKAAKETQELRKATAEADTAERSTGGMGDIFYENGKRVRAQDSPDAEKTSTQREGLDAYSLLVGRIQQIRKKYNGVTDRMVNSDEYRQLKSDYANTILNEMKVGGFTRPTDAVEKLLGEKSGGLSATDWRDITAGLDEGLRASITSFNAHLQKYNGDGPGERVKRYEPPKFEPAAAAERTADENGTVLTQGIRPDQRKDPEKRAAAIETMGIARDTALDDPNLPPEKLLEWSRKLGKQVENNELTRDEGIALVAPMAPRIIAAEHERFQGLGTDKLLELQKDPRFVRRVTLLGLAEDGKATPAQLFELATSGAE